MFHLFHNRQALGSLPDGIPNLKKGISKQIFIDKIFKIYRKTAFPREGLISIAKILVSGTRYFRNAAPDVNLRDGRQQSTAVSISRAVTARLMGNAAIMV